MSPAPNRKSSPTILLRESRREEARVENSPLANLTHWPAEKIVAPEQVLKGRTTANYLHMYGRLR
jgi:hypothetical protein